MRYKGDSIEEREAAVKHLREFLRFNYVTGSQAAQRIGVRDTTLYAWLQGKSKPRSAVAARIIAFLDSLPAERAGIVPTGYEYREYKNWRGIPKPRRCPFCKQAKGEIRKVRAGLQGVCPNCGATGPKREGYDRALLAWNGKIRGKANRILVWSMCNAEVLSCDVSFGCRTLWSQYHALALWWARPLVAHPVALRSSEFKLKSGIKGPPYGLPPIYSVLSLSSLPLGRWRGHCILLLIIARSFLASKNQKQRGSHVSHVSKSRCDY